MIISRLYIEKLYGHYGYDIEFNSDITLLYGTNGCGKTTVLNIITAIITGNLYRLISYEFEKIRLEYYNEKEKKVIYDIDIMKKNDEEIEITFKEKKAIISKLQLPEDRRGRGDSKENMYLKEYPILNTIREEFNYVYLALNRASSLTDVDDYYYYAVKRRRFSAEKDDIIEPDDVDPGIRKVESLVMRQYMRATSQINAINIEFRNAILKSALDVNVQFDFGKWFSDFDIKELKEEDILKINDSYVNILSDLNLISDEEKEQYQVFFEEYSRKVKILRESKEIEAQDLFSLFIDYNEMKKINGIVDIAEEAEDKKSIVMQPIETFLEIVNKFVSSSDFKKKIDIEDGKIYFTTEDGEQKLSIQYLSSGERQILVFFANLIFGVKDTSSGIFVVDEPELSLHLSWQKVFVKEALGVNNNVQFIFATHAPEIVGSYRNKMKKLQRTVQK